MVSSMNKTCSCRTCSMVLEGVYCTSDCSSHFISLLRTRLFPGYAEGLGKPKRSKNHYVPLGFAGPNPACVSKKTASSLRAAACESLVVWAVPVARKKPSSGEQGRLQEPPGPGAAGSPGRALGHSAGDSCSASPKGPFPCTALVFAC